VTKEYPTGWDEYKTPYYPINDDVNEALRERYMELARCRNDVIFGGRLATYRYMNMNEVVASALDAWEQEAKS
jgi:UDP-galactopyranose mutase